MTSNSDLIQKDLRHIWHPCAQMKDFEQCPPIIVQKAQGSYLYTDRGRLIDAGSSWWCKSLGHGHPKVLEAIREQLNQFEHVIAANTTHPKLAELGERLAALSQKQQVFFASDGASAVEIAMKLAMHACQIKGSPHKKNFIALQHGYHGETFATLSISDLGLYKKPYEGFGPACHFIENLPYVSSPSDPLWSDASAAWEKIEPSLSALKDEVCAIVLEPIVQGAAGMRCYSADFLRRLANWAKKHGIYWIADEIMTGLCRTGEWLAVNHAGVSPDLICLSKGLTSGTLPLSVVLIDKAIYDLFYDDYAKGQSFLHSHTFSGNALAVSAALATLQVMQEEDMNKQAMQLGQRLWDGMQSIASSTQCLTNIRGIGALVAADLPKLPGLRVSQAIYEAGLKRGVLLRPIDNTLIWLPPLTTSASTIEELTEKTALIIKDVF